MRTAAFGISGTWNRPWRTEWPATENKRWTEAATSLLLCKHLYKWTFRLFRLCISRLYFEFCTSIYHLINNTFQVENIWILSIEFWSFSNGKCVHKMFGCLWNHDLINGARRNTRHAAEWCNNALTHSDPTEELMMFNAVVSPQLHTETRPCGLRWSQRKMGPWNHTEGGQTKIPVSKGEGVYILKLIYRRKCIL